MIGFDLDGTLTKDYWTRFKSFYELVLNQCEKGNRFAIGFMKLRLSILKCTLVPDESIVIISSRPEYFRDVTIAWLDRNNIKYGHICLPPLMLKTTEEKVNHKAEHILKRGVTRYIEDESMIRRGLILKLGRVGVNIISPETYKEHYEIEKVWRSDVEEAEQKLDDIGGIND